MTLSLQKEETLKATLVMLEQKEMKLRAQKRVDLLQEQQQQQQNRIDESYSFENPIHDHGEFR